MVTASFVKAKRWAPEISLALLPILLLAAALLVSATNAHAAGKSIPHGTLELISENPWVAAGHWVNLGLRFELEKGWHIYWINPGDSGEPPHVQWQLPAGFTVGETKWPAPRRLGASSVVDFGYEDAVTLIVPLRAGTNVASQKRAQLAAEVRVLVCREMCIPGKTQLSLILPVKSQPPTTDATTESLFAAARKSLPRPAPGSWRFSVAEANGSFILTVYLGRQIKEAAFYPLVESQIDNAAPQKVVLAAGGFQLMLTKSNQLLKPIKQLKGVLVLSDQAFSIDVPVSKPGAAASNYDNGTRATKSSEEGQRK